MTYDIQDKSIHFRSRVDAMDADGGPFWRTMLAQSRGVELWEGPIDWLSLALRAPYRICVAKRPKSWILRPLRDHRLSSR
jgi:hypothetical protein